MKKIFYLFFMTILIIPLFAESVPQIKIWSDVPSMQKETDSTLFVYRAPEENNTGAAVIVCPGGSYYHLAMGHEGKKVGEWFKSIGVTAFVLKYRVAGKGYHHPAMLEDIQRSIQIVRENAEQYGLDVKRVGAVGFSAGGHLVLMAGAFGGSVNELEKLGIETNVSLKPNFIVSIYPVVSMQDDIAHKWSRKSLLGKDQSQQRKDQFSMELRMEKDMPPVFLMANKDDHTVKYQNSVRLDEALTLVGVEHKFILGEKGDHGFGMGNNNFVKTTNWPNAWLLPWLKEIGMLKEE